MTTRRLPISLVVCVTLAAGAAGIVPAMAHRDVERSPEVWSADERLLISDSATGEIVVLDDGDEFERLSTPMAPISLARSDDGTLAFALRGRNTDRDHVTVIDTAYDESTGEARRPYVARSFIGHAPGGVSHGRLPELAGAIGIADEETGRLILLNPGELAGLGDALAGEMELHQPDHYAFVTGRDGSGREVLHAGHLRAGGVQVLDATTGEQLAWHGGCPGLHGGTAEASGEHVLFGCGSGVLVTPMDPGSAEPVRFVPYPAGGRIASFHTGSDGVIWGTTEGAQSAIYRVNTSTSTPSLERLDLANGRGTRTAIRTAATPGGGQLLVLTHQGFLQIRDGYDGTLRHEVPIGEKFDLDFHEHVDRAEAPDLAPTTEHVHVSLPDAGRIVTVDLSDGRVIDKIKIGGVPTRMVLLSRP